MCSEIKIFENSEFGDIRTIVDGDKVLFCGNDVAKALGYDQPHKAIDRHCRYGMKCTVPHPQSKDKSIEMLFIPEGDVYRLISHSKLPSAEKFERWVFDDVLPTIRKHGVYATPEALMQMLAEPENAIKIFEALRDEREKNKQLSEKIALDAPKVHFSDTVAESEDLIKIRDMAKLLCENGVNIGERRLYALLRDEKILMKDNIPYQQFIDRGYFKVKERPLMLKANTGIVKTTYVTARGQIWIANKIKDWMAA